MSLNCAKAQELNFDFVVAGGGLAGFCAAVAAARHGLRTALVHDRPVLGGNSSSEIRVAPLGSASFNAWTRETGILEELLLAERARNHDDIYDGMANSHYDLVLYEAAKREPNLSVFFNTTVRGVDAEPVESGLGTGVSGVPAAQMRRITALHGSQLAAEKELIFRGAHFADCTGDATVGALAGAEFRYGREARGEFNEPLAPETSDAQTMGSTLTMRARNIGRPAPFTAPDWIKVYKTAAEIGPHREPDRFNRVDYGGYWWIEIGTPYHQISDNQAIKEELLKHVLGVWNYIKNYGSEREAAANYALEWIGMVPGKRESRRLAGDVIMTEHDCHHDRRWPDRVAYAGWFIDLHTMGGILNKKEAGEPAWTDAHYRNWVRVPPFSIPLRALYSRNVANLWMAGRNISVTHVALGSTRVMMTHALQGQAVGTAAAYAIRRNLSPRQAADPAAAHIQAIQQELLKDDQHVFGACNEDPADLARGAKAAAASAARLDISEVAPNEYQDLGQYAQGLVVPFTHGRLDEVEVFLKNDGAVPVTVPAELQELEQMWQREPGKTVARFSFIVPPGGAGWVKARLKAKTTPNLPHRLCLGPVPQVFWARSKSHPTGVLHQFLYSSPGGCEPASAQLKTFQEIALPAYSFWSQLRREPALAARLTPAPVPYGAGNVNNGYAWPFVMPNLWISDPKQALPQALTLDFGGPKRFNTVYVSFDTDLKSAYHDMRAFHLAQTCVRKWRLYARCDGQWRQIYEEDGNFQRRRKAVFAPVTATELKLEVCGTNASPAQDKTGEGKSARVYELRVYNE